MRAERVEVSWDKDRSSWLIRITNGEEVIRRHCSLPRSSDEQALRSAIQKTVLDEGYELNLTDLSIRAPEFGGG
jgi:hypothetical protein